jgi:hypothetical protein
LLTCGNRSDQYLTAPARRVAPRFGDLTLAAAPSTPCITGECSARLATLPCALPLMRIRFPAVRYSVSRRVTSTPPTNREVRLYTTAPIVDIAVISTMLSEPSRAV